MLLQTPDRSIRLSISAAACPVRKIVEDEVKNYAVTFVEPNSLKDLPVRYHPSP